MAMMSLLNSCERDLKGWLALFQQASPALRLVNVTQHPESALAVMELELVDLNPSSMSHQAQNSASTIMPEPVEMVATCK